MTPPDLKERLRAGLEQLKDWPDTKPAANFRAMPKMKLGDYRLLLADFESLEARIARLEARLSEATDIIEGFAPLTDEGSRTRLFLAARALASDGGGR